MELVEGRSLRRRKGAILKLYTCPRCKTKLVVRTCSRVANSNDSHLEASCASCRAQFWSHVDLNYLHERFSGWRFCAAACSQGAARVPEEARVSSRTTSTNQRGKFIFEALG